MPSHFGTLSSTTYPSNHEFAAFNLTVPQLIYLSNKMGPQRTTVPEDIAQQDHYDRQPRPLRQGSSYN